MDTTRQLRDVITNVLVSCSIHSSDLKSTDDILAVRDHLVATLSQTFDWKFSAKTD
jgi:hypothetical protein